MISPFIVLYAACVNIFSEFRVSAFQAENEVQSLLRRNRVLEDERDQIESRLRTTLDRLQDASKLVDEFERLLALSVCRLKNNRPVY